VVIALFAALFFWLTSLYGPTTAALVIAAVALVLGLMALLPLVVGRRPARPPPAPHTTTAQFAQTAPSLALKRPLLSAFLLAVALGIMARGSSSSYEKKQRACEGRTPSAINDGCGSWPLSESRFLLSPL
jgi:hypothetical protein